MKVLLMHRDHDFELGQRLPQNEKVLTSDLELDILFGGMARGDKFLLDVGRKAVLSSLVDLDAISYRQNVLKDCLKNPSAVRDVYKIAVEAQEGEQQQWLWYDKSPESILRRAAKVLYFLADKFKELRKVADEHAGSFESEGFRAFFATLKEELSDEYIAEIQAHLSDLNFRNGALVSAELGNGNKGMNYTLRKQRATEKRGLSKLFSNQSQSQYRYKLDDGDELGPRLLLELKERGMNSLANALARSCDYVLGYFVALRTELAFYIGCLNLQERLAQKGEPTCFPLAQGRGKRAQSFEGLYDVCLTLKLDDKVVGNDVSADGKDLVIITGANRGGKSTFLRSVGLAQLLMQCGAFVPAASFSSDVCEGLFTHFKREEDPTMKSGKLDEELSRMSDIVDHLKPNCMALFNESFSATNEREGSEIARQIVTALLERGIKVFFVTHQYEFARGLYDRNMANALFLRAERKAGGERTFKIVRGEPLQTSYGEDLYNKIFLGTA
jgi:DNA mismatch repair ATPase MutS